MARAANKTQENRYSQYKSAKTWEKNRIKRLERAFKEQPNNKQIENALKGGLVYRRKTPKTRMWSKTWIRIAGLFKLFEGRFDPRIMSSNDKVSREALQQQSKTSVELSKVKKQQSTSSNDFFSIATRLASK